MMVDLTRPDPAWTTVGRLTVPDFDYKAGARCTAGPEGDLLVAARSFVDETHGPSEAIVKRLDPRTGRFSATSLRLGPEPTWWWVEPSGLALTPP